MKRTQQSEETRKPLVTARRASMDYGVPVTTLNGWCRRGVVQGEQRWMLGATRPIWCINRASLEAWMKSLNPISAEEVDT